MRELFATLQRAARTNFTVLIEGETGTGKELAARAVHEASPRRENGMVVFDAAAVPEHLLESHLFGHVKGAFTGADTDRVGVVEEAADGTLFIDELGELPLHMQPKLLRVLEQREVCRLGSHEVRPVDVRIVAATNRDLAADVNDGTFRDDLYYRLAVIRVVLPPLRKRREDIEQLVEHFIMKALTDKERAREVVDRIDKAAWADLKACSWPGNVRQLRNVIECGLALAAPRSRFHRFRRSEPSSRDTHPQDVGAALRASRTVDRSIARRQLE
jgi:transcriptional regulator with PAS, ATPase and Fis domain